MVIDTLDQLLESGPLTEIRLDLTTRCNLRCVYCAVSQSTYQGADIPLDMALRAVDMIGQFADKQRSLSVHVNGHGETTYLKGWVEICRLLLDKQLPLVLTTNLAKKMSDDELEVMARMNTIMVSIDTADADLLRRLRRKVSLSQIVENIRLIRETSLRLDYSLPPNFRISCGLYDQNSLVIEDLARLAVSLGVEGVGFWNLSSWSFDKFPYENTDVVATDRAFPLDDLSNEALRPRLEAIQRAIDILNRNNIEVHINGDFIHALSRRLEEVPTSEVAGNRSHHLPEGTTRDCLDPWTYFELNTNGDIQPCCAHSRIGNLQHESLSEALNGSTMRQLRDNLLKGTPDPECANCRLRAPIQPAALQEKVHTMLENPDGNFGVFLSQKVNVLMRTAVENLEAGRKQRTWSLISRALAIDPGIERSTDYNAATISECLPAVLEAARFPLTLSSLAAVFRCIQDDRSSILLLKRYLEIAPDAPDRDGVLAWIRFTELKLESTAGPNSAWQRLRQNVRLRTRLRSWLS